MIIHHTAQSSPNRQGAGFVEQKSKTRNNGLSNTEIRGCKMKRYSTHISHSVLLALSLMIGAPAFAQNVQDPVAKCEPNVVRKIELGKYVDATLTGAGKDTWERAKWLNKDGLITMSVASDRILADGKTQTDVVVKLYSSDGVLEKKTTRFWVETLGGYLHAVDQQGRDISGSVLDLAVEGGVACFKLVSPEVPGIGTLRIASGTVGLQGDVTFYTSSDKKPLLAVGIVEGSYNFTTIKRNIQAPELVRTGFEDVISGWTHESETVLSDGTERRGVVSARTAFFIKGVVKGEYLLTAAADSDKVNKERLFKDVDPNQFYPVYGDSSIKTLDAQSTGPLYVKVSKDKSYLMYGDFTTASGKNRLFSINRSLTGIKYNYVNDNADAVLWVSRTEQRNFVEEQPARGISGPYAVEHPNALTNSETIQIITRDLRLPSRIVKVETKQRGVDYSFEPFSGRIIFSEPIASIDEFGNPNFIRISYEVEDGNGDKNYVYGGDVKFDLGSDFSISVGASEDRNPLAPYKIQGLAVDWQMGAGFGLSAELAQTDSERYNQTITMPINGGPLSPVNANQGKAKKIELNYQGSSFQAKAFGQKADDEFENNASGVTAGLQVTGVSASTKIDEGVSLSGDTQQTKNLSTDGVRKTSNVTMGIDLSSTVKWDIGVSQVKEDNAVGTTTPAIGDATGIGYGFNQTSLLASAPVSTSQPTGGEVSYVSLRTKVGWKLSDISNLFAEYEHATSDNRYRIAVGGDHRFTDTARMYARAELNDSLTGADGLISDGGRRTSFSLGLDTTYMEDGQLFSEYRLGRSTAGVDQGVASGVRNLWHVAKDLSMTTSAELQNSKSTDGSITRAKAATLGAEYTPNRFTKVGGKLEFRNSETANQWLNTLAYDRMLTRSWTAVVRNTLLLRNGKAGTGDQRQGQLQVGVAYRDTATNRFHGLGRWEHRVEETTGTTSDIKSKADIFSVHGNYRGMKRYSVSGQVAYKTVTDDFNAGESKWSAYLLSSRLLVDFGSRMDFGLFGSINRGEGTTVSGIGLEVGAKLVKDLWFSVGYNQGEYSDVDMFSADQSWTGFHARLRWKFDEDSFGQTQEAAKSRAPYASTEARQGSDERLRQRRVKELAAQTAERDRLMKEAIDVETKRQAEEAEKAAALLAAQQAEQARLKAIEAERVANENKVKEEKAKLAAIVKEQELAAKRLEEEKARIEKERMAQEAKSREAAEAKLKEEARAAEQRRKAEEVKLAAIVKEQELATKRLEEEKAKTERERLARETKQRDAIEANLKDEQVRLAKVQEMRMAEEKNVAALAEQKRKQAQEAERLKQEAEAKRILIEAEIKQTALAGQQRLAEEKRKQEEEAARLAEQQRIEQEKLKAARASTVYRQAEVQMDELFEKTASDEAGLLPLGRAKLDVLVKMLKSLAEVESLSIAVHTDGVGDKVTQYEMAFARGNTISRYLVERGLLKPEVLNMADSKKLKDCGDVVAQAQYDCNKPNRRVVFTFKGKMASAK